MDSFGPIIHRKEKQNAGKQIKPQRTYIAYTMPGKKFVGQFPWLNNKPGDRFEEL